MDSTLADSLSFDEYNKLLESISDNQDASVGLQELIDQGVDINHLIDDDCKLSPIHWASAYGNKKAVEILLGNGVDINLPDESFMPATPMEHAAKGGYVDLVRLFLEKGAKKTEWTKTFVGDNESIQALF